MNRRQRLVATLKGETVDRPPVSFYEINGLDESPDPCDSFNIYTHPSWAPLIALAREKSDRIVMRGASLRSPAWSSPTYTPADASTITTTLTSAGSRITRLEVRIGRRTLTSTTRRDPDVNTTWQVEHLLKNSEDVKAYLDLPQPIFAGNLNIDGVLTAEAALGDSGIVMIDTPDPLCQAASLFDLGTYTVIAATEPDLFHQLLDWFAEFLTTQTEAMAQALPGRLWRIYGPEYASPPYLHPRLFREYVTAYDTPLVSAIQRHGGFARIHSHGRLRAILADIAATGCLGLDPIEPPPQGDIELIDVRRLYGQQMVLFGNLEASDLENLPTPEFEQKIRKALLEGTAGHGRGFVLLPSSCPYGRVLSPLALANYQKMIEVVEQF
ncbi:MAG TPA: uroporphyrinogen decarboxylase family protein [Anaerolineaceae bacterium]